MGRIFGHIVLGSSETGFNSETRGRFLKPVLQLILILLLIALIGSVRRCPVHDIRLVALVNNTVRGAAGAAILNAELMVSRDLIGASATEVRKAS